MTVRTLLASRYPMLLLWGPQLVQIYNDAYAAILGSKHPAALGIDVRLTLPEAWTPWARWSLERLIAAVERHRGEGARPV